MCKFLDKTIEQIKSSKIAIAKIARDNDLEPRYLRDIVNGKIKNPGYCSMRRVEDYLEKHFQKGNELSRLPFKLVVND